jgi:hypothetical protein
MPDLKPLPALLRCATLALLLTLPLAASQALAAPLARAPVSGPALQDRLCPAKVLAAPLEAALPGCQQAHCTAVGEQSVCACQRSGGWRFEHRQGGRVLQHWRTEISPMMGASAFEVTLADLDGDGQPEWLVALLQSVSNGMGVSHHTLCTVTAGQPTVVCRDVSEWGALSVLVAESGRPGCGLLHADWQSGREPGRVDGTYAVGRLWRWQGGRWQRVPAVQRPAVARRLLREFEAERSDLPQRNAQRLWYQHPAAGLAACPGPLCPRP